MQGRRQGHAQGHVQDGHLDAAELPRRADLRGDRPQPRASSTRYFTGTAVAHRGHRPRRRSRARAPTRHHARLPSRRRRSTATLDAGGQYQWRRRGERHMCNPDTIAKLQHAVRAGNYPTLQGVHARSSNDQSRELVHAARPARVQARQADPARRGRAGRARSSSASRPARCRSARSAARRTRPSRSR